MPDGTDTEGFFCYVCGLQEENVERLIECVNCNRFAHFKCKKIFGFSVNTVKQKPYLCSTECKKMNSTQTAGGNEEVLKELRALSNSVRESTMETATIRGALMEIQTQMKKIAETNESIEKSQSFISKEFEDLKMKLDTYKQEVEILKRGNSKVQDGVNDLYEKNHELTSKVEQLELELDRVNRARLSKNVIIVGLPLYEGENTKKLVRILCGAIGFKCGEEVIQDARRLVSKKEANRYPPILVTFNTEKEKETLFEMKRKYGVLQASQVADVFNGINSRVTVRDEVTEYGRKLLREVKELQLALNLKYVWPGRNGKVLIRRQDGSNVEQVCNMNQVRALARSSYKRTASSSPMSSSFKEPSPKKTSTN